MQKLSWPTVVSLMTAWENRPWRPRQKSVPVLLGNSPEFQIVFPCVPKKLSGLLGCSPKLAKRSGFWITCIVCPQCDPKKEFTRDPSHAGAQRYAPQGYKCAAIDGFAYPLILVEAWIV